MFRALNIVEKKAYRSCGLLFDPFRIGLRLSAVMVLVFIPVMA